MKLSVQILLSSVATLCLANAAFANPTVCIAGQLNADGTFKLVSGNPAQVAVLDNGSVTLYTLNDEFSLYNTHYNIHDSFDMSLVTSMGAAGTYTQDTKIETTWTIADDG